MKFKMTTNEYNDHQESYNGFCTKCGEVAWGSTEPDARGYECESCGSKSVYGMLELLVSDQIEIEE